MTMIFWEGACICCMLTSHLTGDKEGVVKHPIISVKFYLLGSLIIRSPLLIGDEEERDDDRKSTRKSIMMIR